jgi:hypothetical protein
LPGRPPPERAHGLAGLPGRLARPGRVQRLVDDPLGYGRVALQEELELLAHDLLDDAVDLGVGELGLGLALEAGLRDLDRHHRDKPLAHVVARDRRVLLLYQVVAPGEIVDDARERRLEARQVRAALKVVDRVGVGEDLVVVAVVVLHRHVDDRRRL